MTRFIVVGIGNPGEQYRDTFHNAGASFVAWNIKDTAWNARTHVRYAAGDDVAYALTTTFMNESGRGVREIADWLKVDPGHVIVAHDDTDQELGAIKLVFGGGSGGHNGIKSITEALGTPDFWRLKIGARPARFAGPPHIKAENFVLNKLGEHEKALLQEAFAKAQEKLEELTAQR